MARLRGSDDVVVRDVTDVDHPATLCRITGTRPSQGPLFAFADATHVAWTELGPARITVADLVRGTRSSIPVHGYGVFVESAFAFGPDGTTLTYLADVGDARKGPEWHLVVDNVDRLLAQLTYVPGRGAGPRGDDNFIGFSPSGKYIAIVTTHPESGTDPNSARAQVRSLDGTLLLSSNVGTMATWTAGDTLLAKERGGSSLLSWRPGQAGLDWARIGPSLDWIQPMPSADGKSVAYETNPAVYGTRLPLSISYWRVGDLAGTRPTTRGTFGARFLTPTLLWYGEEVLCQSGDPNPCPYSDSLSNGNTYIFDIAAGREYPSIITSIEDTWPHLRSEPRDAAT